MFLHTCIVFPIFPFHLSLQQRIKSIFNFWGSPTKAKRLAPFFLVPFSCLAVSCGEERLEKMENVISLFQAKGNRGDGDLLFRDLDVAPR